MTGFLTDYTGALHMLPVLTGWDVTHGPGYPCDCFEISMPYDKSLLQLLSDATRFSAEHDGKIVFTGVVDEFEVSCTNSGGSIAAVRGRSLAALLLDNEAEPNEYYYASLDFILGRHVYPWGIKDVKTKSVPAQPVFTVAGGSSQWRVLEDFIWFGAGIRPRFDREGVLLLDGSQGDYLLIDAKTAVSEMTYRERRYGVISRALMVNKPWGISQTVDNTGFLARGGSCRRVVNVPRGTYYDAMRHTGEYQIERSMEESAIYELTCPALFAAFPGDTVLLQDSPIGVSGELQVRETRCWADGKSAGTHMRLEARL